MRWGVEVIGWLTFCFFCLYCARKNLCTFFFLVYSVHNQRTWNRVCFVDYFYHKRTWRTKLFFCFCLHHFRIRILYLSLQRVSYTWFFSLISAMPLPQLICHKFFDEMRNWGDWLIDFLFFFYSVHVRIYVLFFFFFGLQRA